MLPVSNLAFGRLLKEAILLPACHATLSAILRYAETLSTDGIDTSALDTRAWALMKDRIDAAARRSASAREAAKRRKTAQKSKPKPKPAVAAAEEDDDPLGIREYVRQIKEPEERRKREEEERRQREQFLERQRRTEQLLGYPRPSVWDIGMTNNSRF